MEGKFTTKDSLTFIQKNVWILLWFYVIFHSAGSMVMMMIVMCGASNRAVTAVIRARS